MSARERPRLLMVARTRYALPLSASNERKFAALRGRFDLRVLATSADGTRTGRRCLSARRAAAAPRRAALLRAPARSRPSARAERTSGGDRDAEPLRGGARRAGPSRRCPRRRAARRLAHGDAAVRIAAAPPPRAARRPVGSLGIRHADAVRTISPFTSGLVRAAGVEPAGEFVAFIDLDAFAEPPPTLAPAAKRLLFVGVLERYKDVEGLAAAWRLAAARVPGAELQLVGSGSLTAVVEGLVAEGIGVRWDRRLEPPELARALDAARALVLPSRSEGLPRIVIEAFVRGRAVIGSRAGGIPDIVEDGVNGLLVEPGSAAALAAAIERVLVEDGLAARLGEGAADSAVRWTATAEQYAERMGALVDQVAGAR